MLIAYAMVLSGNRYLTKLLSKSTAPNVPEEEAETLKKRTITDWTLQVLGENCFDIPKGPIQTTVPSTVYSTLLDHHLIPDPFYRDNELLATRLLENDFLYETTISFTPEEQGAERLLLRFSGIDTIAELFLDEHPLGPADNMHRTFEYPIPKALQGSGEHHLSVLLRSPIRYIKEENDKCPVGYSPDAMPGFPHIRKAACMFGWDWGPRLPDAGLFRPVEILSFSDARLESVFIRQTHAQDGAARVLLTAEADAEFTSDIPKTEPTLLFTVISPDGSKVWISDSMPASECTWTIRPSLFDPTRSARFMHLGVHLSIDHPELWWPNGYGDQPLYQVRVDLLDGDRCMDTFESRIGLRTVTVNTDKLPGETWDPHLTRQTPDYDDGKNTLTFQGGSKQLTLSRHDTPLEGQNFAIQVNGLQVFAMGADYIPEDNLLTRQNRERTNLLLTTARESGFNCIRIWGGGYFPDDAFYDLCDEKGILIWQDMMFTCASYELSPAFAKNLDNEFRQNIRRLRNHPCLALWCGNNELEMQYESGEWAQTPKQHYDYIRLFEAMIPGIVHEEHPEAFYWPSSPSSGGNFQNSAAENRGDTHYWGVWHGNEPFTAYRQHHFRFLSEFGFQSFPAMPTIRRFAAPEDLNVFSRVMEMHQRNSAANGKILNYLSASFLYPKSFDALVYCSQLLQAEAIRYGVEHFRRHRGTCMGTIVWQLNDCWPVASWSSVDYYGNWKALQYAEKRMFAPVLLSCEEHGELDQKPFPNSMPVPIDVSADLHVANETRETIHALVRWSLRLPDSSIVRQGEFPVTVAPFSGTWLPHLDFNDQDPLEVHLDYELFMNGRLISSGVSLFCAPKHYHFRDPKLTLTVSDDTCIVTADAFARFVSVESDLTILRFEDNFVDMEKGTHIFHLLPSRDFTHPGTAALPETLRVRSLYDAAEHPDS